MRQKEQTSLTGKRCPQSLKKLINDVNLIDGISASEWEEIEKTFPGSSIGTKALCRGVHELAQLASLRIDMREGYAKAVVGTDEEWKRFCRSVGADLWRKWPGSFFKPWPQMIVTLAIGDDGRIGSAEEKQLLSLLGIEAKRLRECRVCQKIFWASRIEKSGGPFGCSPRCNNTLYQKDFRARKKP